MKILAFLKRDFWISISYKLPFLIQIIGIIFSLFIFYYVSKLVGSGQNNILDRYGGSYFSFLLIGIAFSDFFLTSINSFAEEIRKGQLFGTLEAILVTPLSVPKILIYSSCYNYIFSSFRFMLYFLFGKIFFDLTFSSINFFLVVIVFMLSLFSFWGIGMISATFVIIFKQSSPLKWLLGSSTGLLGGIFYPSDILPTYLQCFSNLLPITHSIEALRLILFKGADFYDIKSQVIVLSVFAVLLFSLGLYTFKIGLKIAKKNGSLLHY